MVDRTFDFLRRNFPELSLCLCAVSIVKAFKRRSSIRARLICSLWTVCSLQAAVNGFRDRANRSGMYR